MIHKTTTMAPAIEKVQAEVIYVPPTPSTLDVIPQKRTYSKRTLFEGNRRRLLWEGLGEDVSGANSAYEVCKLAGLNFEVRTEPIYTADGIKIPNLLATRRYDTYENGVEVPSTVYGAVTDRYNPVQNYEGFDFIDTLFHHDGFEVETAGHFNDGKIVWVEARIPQRNMAGEKIDPYLVFTNRHDGKGSVKVFYTSVRVVCKNTLNLAIKGAQGRSFSVRHTTTAQAKLEQAKQTLENYYLYLGAMEKEIEREKSILLEDKHLDQMVNTLLQFKETDSDRTKQRVLANRQELKSYYYAAELDGYEKSAFRFMNAVSDWATHRTPARQTANYASNLFQKTLDGNEYIDAAYTIIDEFAATANKMIAMA